MTQQPAYPPPPPGVPISPPWPALTRPPSGPYPSGLFPSGPPLAPRRPTYREPHPVRGLAVAGGVGATLLWFLLIGLIGRDLAGWLRWTAVAAALAWLAAFVLVRKGDRGVAVGVAATCSLGVSLAVAVLAWRWSATGDWPLW